MKHARSAIAVLALAASASFATPAAAQSVSANRFYVGGTLGQSTASHGCSGIVLPAINCNDSDTAWRVLGGYIFNQNLSLELGYQDLGQVSAAPFGATGDVTANVWELVAVGTLPLKNRFSIYGKLGGYRGSTERRSPSGFSASETNTDITVGIGARYDYAPQLAFRAEYQSYQSMGGGSVGQSDFDVISVGALYNFQ